MELGGGFLQIPANGGFMLVAPDISAWDSGSDIGSGFTIDTGSSWWQPVAQTAVVGGISYAQSASRTGAVKEQLTALANSAEAALQQNLGAWQAGQITADAAATRAWAVLNDMVRRMLAAGPQGQTSAAERDRRIDPSRLRWDWIAYYIDPIPGSAQVAAQAAATGTAASAAGLAGYGSGPLTDGSFPWTAILIGAVLLLVFVR